MADKRTTKPAGKAGGSRSVRRDSKSGNWQSKRSAAAAPGVREHAVMVPRRPRSGDVVVTDRRVTLSGPPRAVEDYLDAQEIDRRLADPENRQHVPWSELKTKRGL